MYFFNYFQSVSGSVYCQTKKAEEKITKLNNEATQLMRDEQYESH
jgi:hypothetical protein